MTTFGGSPRRGDWVTAVATIPVTLADHLRTDAGIHAGTRGVVLDDPRGWFQRTVTVRFDIGLGGLHDVQTPMNKIKVSRRGAGLDTFTTRARWLAMLRLGVAIALSIPVLYFVLVYLWTFHTVDGLLTALMTTCLDSAGAMVGFALDRPLQAAMFLLASWALGRFAFR